MSYRFSGRSGMFFNTVYSSQIERNALELAMARVCPCMFFFNGKCSINADSSGTKCIGAKIKCEYYTKKFKYLIKEYVDDGKGIFSEHVLEIFKAYLNYDCPYQAVIDFATVDGISAYMGTDENYDGSPVVLPRRALIENGNIETYPYHPPSTNYSDYISFVTSYYFKLLFPRLICLNNIKNTIYQSSYVSVLLDVPGNGYTYVIYISELGLSESTINIIDNFFDTGYFVSSGGNNNLLECDSVINNLTRFFRQVFIKLSEKEKSNFIINCDNIGFGISLATLYSKYDLSKCLIIYSENKLIFNEDMFDLNSISIGMFDISKVVSLQFDMSYCDINFGSNNLYDLATDYTLDVSYKGDIKSECPKVHADYKGQDLTFGVKVSLFNAGKKNYFDDKNITVTALPLPWYNSNEVSKKYLWELKKEEITYELDVKQDEFEKEFDLGKVTIFKNMVILDLNSLIFPFYIKDCTYNSYKYVTKYQAYHPMLEYYDIDPKFSFVLKKDYENLTNDNIIFESKPNINRTQSQNLNKVNNHISVELLKSLSTGIVFLVPDVNECGSTFGNTISLKFTVVKCKKLEYLPKKVTYEDDDLFIPTSCNNVEHFDIGKLSGGLGACEEPVIVKSKNNNKDQTTDMSLSEFVKNPLNEPYYIQINCDLEVDKGTGAIYKQKNIQHISYFYFSYLSFRFLFENLAKKTDNNSGNSYDYKNSDVQKFISGERPLLSVKDLAMSQEERNVTYKNVIKQKMDYPWFALFSDSVSDFYILKSLKEQEEYGTQSNNEKPGMAAYNFSYLYSITTRSYINNKFYEPFSVNHLFGIKNKETAREIYIDSLFGIVRKKETYTDRVKNVVEIKHNFTHAIDVYRGFGLPICGFNENKLDLNNKYSEETKKSIFDKLIIDNFQSKMGKVFYFYLLGISKFVQDCLFFVKYKESIVPVLKRIPVIVSQVGLPDPEVMYKWKSNCKIYTHTYNTGLNPFIKISDVDNLDFFINPFYIITYKNYRDDKYRTAGIKDNRTASDEYGFLFTSDWHFKYKKTLDNYGFITYANEKNSKNIFLITYRTLAALGDKDIIEEKDIVKGFAEGKKILYLELESIDYVYSSYCGDHDFVLGNTTPYLYDRAADFPLSTSLDDPLVEGRKFNGIYYTENYDKYGVSMRRARPCSRFVGPMWFPFRSCEVARYNEFADYPGVRQFINGSEVNRRYIRGFSCTDLIFKPYNNNDIQFSDFNYLFIDDYLGSINPYRYVSSFYSSDVLNYYKGHTTNTFEIAPTYLPSNASIPWRFVPILCRDGDNDSLVIVEPNEFTIGSVSSGTLSNTESINKCVVLDISNYKDFSVGNTGLTISRSKEPESGITRSILYNCLLDIPPMLPYNYNKNKYICGYERMRGGDSSFIYQCIYPFHHNYGYIPKCKYMFDYKNKGEEAYGPIENTLLPNIINLGTTAETIVHYSVFTNYKFYSTTNFGYRSRNMLPCSFFGDPYALDWIVKSYVKIADKRSNSWTESNYRFWTDCKTLKCETDGPTSLKMCLNQYRYIDPVYGDSNNGIRIAYMGENTDCTSYPQKSEFPTYVVNLKSEPLYNHFASAWKSAYNYVFLGASMNNKPSFYGDGALRMFKTYDDLKKSYFIFDDKKEVKNINALPIFGGLGKFFRICYFSINYGLVPFSTLSGINTKSSSSEDSSKDDNYVYKLSGYNNNDVMFVNDFKYGYLPEKNPVFITNDSSLFTSMISFTADNTVSLKIRNAVCFRDFVEYVLNDSEDNSYYRYKGGYDIELTTFGSKNEIKSGPAMILIYDTSVNSVDKYSYYSNCGCVISIADPICDDMGVVIDPFPFGEKVKIEYKPLLYSNGYLQNDYIVLKITGLNCCKAGCEFDIKVKENNSAISGFSWMFYVEENGTDVQKVYVCYDNFYNIGKLVEKDESNSMLLSDYDVIQKEDSKYKINRGFYIDFSNMILPYSTNIGEYDLLIENVNSSQSDIYLVLEKSCFIISLEGNIYLLNKYECHTIIGHLDLETSDEYYAVGDLIVYPNFDISDENFNSKKYDYKLKFIPHSNYNRIKYCGVKYKFIFNYANFLHDLSVTVKYGIFSGGTLCEVTFNEVSSLKAITYENINNVNNKVAGINLYNENLNDKIMVDKAIFYTMPFGFVNKLKSGISNDKDIKFKEGYNNEFIEGLNLDNVVYTEDDQKLLDRISLPVERDVFNLIHYSTSFTKFCLKSKLIDDSCETIINLDMSLTPDLYKSLGYFVIPQWTAGGHKLDLYSDSFYSLSQVFLSGVPRSWYEAIAKLYYSNNSLIDAAKNDLDVLSGGKHGYCDYYWLFNKCGVLTDAVWNNKSFNYQDSSVIIPFNISFITHVDHGMFGYPGVTDVSGWSDDPTRPTVFGFYDKNGNKIQKE